MQKIERKKLILIIAVAITALLAGVAIVLSILTGGTPKDTIAPTQEPAPLPTSEVEEPVEPGAPIIDGEEEGAPPESMYQNDYSKDIGYEPIPDGFDPAVNPTENTIFDSDYAYLTYSRVMCELSTKYTATDRALEPALALKDDLALISEAWAGSWRSNITRYQEWFEAHDGERIPADIKDELARNCETDFDF